MNATLGHRSTSGGMEKIIPIFESVRDLLDRTKAASDSSEIQFPQIVVVGSQSSGKSSVLENLVGQPFLPRGNGLVTRCPIILRLVNIPRDGSSSTWVEFQHRPGESFTDFEEVENEIIAQTRKIAGSNYGISSTSIKITVYSPKVLNLTVVDLPGLVQIPVGDQPENIEAQIKELVLQYIKQENAIILAIAPANVDIANAESIRLAKSVDETQERTIVVLTKLDLADDRIKIAQVLKGNIVPMKLGIVGVINRSQADIEANKTIDEVLDFERQFLEEHFPSIAPYHGISYLAQKLNGILRRHIAQACPQLIVRLRDLALTTEVELMSLGIDGELCDNEKRKIIVAIVDKFCKKYKAQIDGQSRSEIGTSSLTTGARINYILCSRLNAELSLLEPFCNLTDEEILMAVANALPVGHRLIRPEVALSYFIQEEVKKTLPLALQIAKCTFKEMVEMIGKCLQENSRFPKINVAIFAGVTELLNERIGCTKEILCTYFEVHSSSSWTSNPAYAEVFKEAMCSVCAVDLGKLPETIISHNNSNGESLSSLSNGSKCPTTGPTHFTPAQLEFCKQMRNLAVKVFEIIRWQTQDFIAKSILSSLIYKTVDNVAKILLTKLTDPEVVDALVREPEDIHARRVCLRKELQDYNDALNLLEKLLSETM